MSAAIAAAAKRQSARSCGWGSASSRLLAALGHELRNPLAAAVAGVSAAAALTDPSDPRHHFLQRGRADLARVCCLLNRYLEFGRGASLRAARIDLVERARQVAASRTPRVSVQTRTEPLIVKGDEVLLGRVLENLVDNALAAGAQRIVVRLSGSAREVRVEVRDDGPGVAPDLRERLFAPFVSGGGGTGIGLALCADVVEAHGGRIGVQPCRRGACFWVTLPAVRAAAARAQQSQA